MKNTKIKNVKTILKAIPFDVEECDIEINSSATKHPFYRLKIKDWVNILAVTKEGEAILIKQDRIGAEESVLEAPGGVVDRGEETSTQIAALRELEEETGYTSNRVISLGAVNPNPAINTNLVHFYLALDAVLPEKRKFFPDEYENIEICKVTLNELPSLLMKNKVNHALSCLLIHRALDYLGNAAK